MAHSFVFFFLLDRRRRINASKPKERINPEPKLFQIISSTRKVFVFETERAIPRWDVFFISVDRLLIYLAVR